MKKNTIQKLTFAAVIAALYAVITLLLSWLSFGPIQFRIAEALTVLPYFSPVAIVGLSIGCLISNLIASPYAWLDILFGTAATVLGAVGTYLLSRKKNQITFWLAPLPTVLANTIIVGAMITASMSLSGQLSETGFTLTLLYNMATVGLGEVVCCYALGIPLMFIIKKYRKALPF